jgi:phage terminase large subunit
MSVLEIATPRWALPLLKPARYKCAWGGRGSGKSHFFGEYIIEQHIAEPNESTVCVREVQKSLDQSVKRLLEQKIQKLNAGWYFEVQDAKIKSTQGQGIITFQGMQNHTADSIKSLEGYKRAWVEEAQTLSQYSLDLLRPTIRTPGSEILFSWNPRYKTDPVDVFFRKSPPGDAIVVMVNWYNNPWFPEELRKEMEHDFASDEDKAEHIWNGAYGASQGAILARYVGKAERSGRIHNDVAYDRDGAPIEVSADLGFRDTASFWYWQRTLGGFRLLAYDGDTGLDASEWIPRIRDKIIEITGGGKLGKIWLPHDARAKTFQSKYTTIEQFAQSFGADKVAIVAQSKKQDQINAARTIIQKCEFHRDNCEAGIDGLLAWEYAYNEENGVFSREPLHNWASHPSDAFAYGCQVMQESAPKEPEKPTIFPVKAQNGRIVTATLDELWAETPKRVERF